jgi:hypothetical protein
MPMNTKGVMILSAVLLGSTGLVFSFLPQESAAWLGWSGTNPVVLQVLGAAYFGFAMTNWTAKANLVGGIYGKPIALGNFTHFAVGALALIKSVMQQPPAILWVVITLLYSLFAIAFGYILFTHPTLKSKKETV